MGTDDQTRAGNQAAAGVEFEWDVLISYGRSDSTELARRIAAALKGRGLRVWIDEDELDAGDELVSEIAEAMEKSRAVAIIVSPASLKSGWVKQETNLAISRSANGDWQLRIIPILAGVDKLPSFLPTRVWVDFTDEAHFEKNIERLIRGVQGGEPSHSEKARSEEERRLLSRLSFLWFFPEGMLSKLYDHLVSETGSGGEAALAERRGLVRAVETDGPELKGAAPEMVSELGGHIADKVKAADELLTAVYKWIREECPFEFVKESGSIGIGRALLVRDVLSLARHLADDDEAAVEKREKASEQAREFLAVIVNEGHRRIGLEVSGALRAVSGILLVTDNLTHARVLLRAGDAAQAADIFHTYRGDNLFDDYGLDRAGRLECALDWAKALKDARRARELHNEIIKAYGQMLELVLGIREEGAESDEVLRREAEVRNNRATQIAQYGRDDEWPVAQEDFDAAVERYRMIGDDERLIATSANAVSHTLDRFDRAGKKITEEELDGLLTSLVALKGYADQSEPGEDLFFFLYQKARVLKRLRPEKPQDALENYEAAALVAGAAGLPHRAAVARRWALRQRAKAEDISEEEYLNGLRACAASLSEYPDEAWSSNALFETHLDITRVLRRRHNKEDAWAAVLEAFNLAARRHAWRKSESARARLENALRMLSGLSVRDELRAAFLSENALLLRALLGIPAYQPVNWGQVAQRLGQQKGADGNSIH